ncbi:unannotated protein [freshwater metagenome]|uniref:Unannotated protein n=1 Tax=freshwater metagenome TaxID=449393 RepID=A0A6J6Y092_9ZZZZ
MHVDGEVGHAFVLRHVRVRAGDEHSPVGEVGNGVPYLLAVDDPLVAVANGLGGEASKVASGTWLAEQLTPALFAGEHRAQEAGALFVGAVGDDGWTGKRQKERRRICALGASRTKTLLDHALQIGTNTQATKASGEVHPREAGIELQPTEFGVGNVLGVVAGEQRGERFLNALRLRIGAVVIGHDTSLSYAAAWSQSPLAWRS